MSTKTPWEIWKEKNSKPWDLINPNIAKVDQKTFNDRFNLCLKCPSLINATKQCKKCGCFMKQKAKLPDASCPIGKWGPVRFVKDVV